MNHPVASARMPAAASARMQEIASQDRTCAVLAYVLTAALFGLVPFLVFHGIPQNGAQRHIFTMAMGTLLTGWTAMVSHYFGCASGSFAKDLLLYQSRPRTVPAVRNKIARAGSRDIPVARVPPAEGNGTANPGGASAPAAAGAQDARPVAAAPVPLRTVPGPPDTVLAAAALADALLAVAPMADAERWLPALQVAMEQWKITGPTGNLERRVAAALGQFAAEAGADFGRLTENLDYTTAARIHAVFPRYFPTVASAEPFCRAPEKLANLVYAHQDGNTQAGDGWRYIGRGLIQLTGKARYQAFATAMGLDLADAVPWCATPAGAAMSACWYLASHGCLDLADKWSVDDISRKVNGAYCTTLDKRRALSERALQAMTPAMAA